MSSIVLATLNARYTHSSFGLRYLLANMGDLESQTTMLEFVISDSTTEILAAILVEEPLIVGLGVYIWNVEPMTRLVADLKRVRPEMIIVLGGPEVSYEMEGQAIVELSDYVIAGEADNAFRELCVQLLNHQPVASKFQFPPVPLFEQLKLPYDLYDDRDVASRVIYVEVSRGCPFTCEFCLSSLEIPVRLANVDLFLSEMQKLLDRGARQFKFVDRTFNLNLRVSKSILQFFLDRLVPELFLHFEMIPDRLPEDLRTLIAQFPKGSLQFEIGIQTLNDDVGKLISRKQDVSKLKENFHYLRDRTGVHIHADLIVGLPGESIESFAAGFDQLIALRPQEIQVGILKRLRGTPITRHDHEWQMVYSPHPPYEILCNRLLSFEQVHRLRRFARYWDLIGNSGNFVETLGLLFRDKASPFSEFDSLCDWLQQRNPKRYGISLIELFESVFEYLRVRGVSSEFSVATMSMNGRGIGGEKIASHSFEQAIAEAMWRDYTRGGRRDRPSFLRPFALSSPHASPSSNLPSRQSRHIVE